MSALALSHQFLHQERAAIRILRDFQTLAQKLNDASGLIIAKSCEARIQLLQGNLDKAVRWAGVDSSPPAFTELFVSLEVPVLTRARIWIVSGTTESLDRALNLLQEIGKRAHAWHFTNQTIETDVLKSLALAGLGREEEAVECLAGAIDLAAHGIWMRPFLEPGKPMVELLMQLDNHGLATDFSRQLLSEIYNRPAHQSRHARTGADLKVALEAELRESMTPCELDVLELLAQRLQNKEITDKLFVSLETVKFHLKNIFQKLDVGKRQEAVEKARRLGII